jgi:hypothetical protein
MSNPTHENSITKPRPTDLNHYRATYQFWLPLMLNYDKFFGGTTMAETFNSQNYASGYISINGISMLACGRATFNGFKAKLVENQRSLENQYMKLMIRKPKILKLKSEEKPNEVANS